MRTKLSIFIAVFAFAVFYARENLQSAIISLLDSRILEPAVIVPEVKTATETVMAPQSTSTSFVGLPVIPPGDPSLNATSPVPRKIQDVFEAYEQAEGAGARVRRSIGTSQLRRLSPFLMLDMFSIGVGAGFPDHPHRGQETITYLLKGSVDHEDFAGHAGTIGPGDLQFMTAGRGIVHAEMPGKPNPDASADEDGVNVGLQLWVDLPSYLKDCEPRYRDLRAHEIPQATSPDGKVSIKVISGRSLGVDSLQELAYTPVWLLDVTIKPGGTWEQHIPHKWNSFVYTLKGNTEFGEGTDRRTVEKYHNLVWAQDGDMIHASVDPDAEGESRFVAVAGLPLDQPVIQYGPFVVNSKEDVYKAMFDYQTFSNGFERAKGWESEIGKSMVH